ncbi:RecA-superfamily ATPases implicated in signal transduction [Archaeoglobus sulfaticallidus PM70-1]|uniref:RecA-superfamily ATPases implicated in signal transduction n=2 Tax=Archaeoglobus TaxID=2233 RepID=N0BLN9_9EURY|nr:RecA-superfamily ATPases implicated in signal transduction [Archaeoglobus sulfaticallidus PM70-1]
MVKSIPTGIHLLDRRLDGGLPEGSLVCVYANPMSMPEAFLYQFASVRKTYYFNTSRPSEYIKQNMLAMGFDPDVEFIDVFSQYYLNEYGHFIIEDRYRDKEIFDFIEHQLNNILQDGKEYNVIFDSMSFFLKLDVSRGLKEWLLNKLYIASKQTGNLFYIYVLKNVHPIDLVYTVMDICDVILDIDSERIGDKILSRLSIPKIRNKQPMLETFRFYISEGIEIDTSRDIA